MTSYRGEEAIACVGMQPIVEPACGLCDNHKPTRISFHTEEIPTKTLNKSLAIAGLLFFLNRGEEMDEQTEDILYQAASKWMELTEYQYIFTYGYKKKLYTVTLAFSPEEFPHLAGFQYLKDVIFPRYNSGKIVNQILNHKITVDMIIKGDSYNDLVKPRIEALVRLKEILDNDFVLFSYVPHLYPFTTMIKADYIISSQLGEGNFIFLVKSRSELTSEDIYLCRSVFKKGERDYEQNQRIRTILKKERLHVPTQESSILYDKLSPHEDN